MNLSRILGLVTLLIQNLAPFFARKYLVVCKEYTTEDEDFVEIAPSEFLSIIRDTSYQTFEVWRR